MYDSVCKRLTHTRSESADTITIVWNSKYTISMYVFILVGFLGSVVSENFGILSFACITLLILQFVYSLIFYAGASREIKSAMAKGKVEAKGSKHSLKNPLTITIRK